MSLSSKSPSDARRSQATPTFDLTFRYDDPANPTEVTVFPAAEDDDRTTAWLTIDAAHAVPFEAVR